MKFPAYDYIEIRPPAHGEGVVVEAGRRGELPKPGDVSNEPNLDAAIKRVRRLYWARA